MSYEKQTWTTGDTITAEKLNHIEEGIESADNGGSISEPIITFNQQPPQMNWSCDKTFSELQDLFGGDGTIQMIPVLFRHTIAASAVVEFCHACMSMTDNYVTICFIVPPKSNSLMTARYFMVDSDNHITVSPVMTYSPTN